MLRDVKQGHVPKIVEFNVKTWYDEVKNDKLIKHYLQDYTNDKLPNRKYFFDVNK